MKGTGARLTAAQNDSAEARMTGEKSPVFLITINATAEIRPWRTSRRDGGKVTVMADFFRIRLDLQRFGEGGGEGGAAGAEGAEAAAEAGNQEGAQSAKPGKTGDLSQVQYGVQEQEAEQKADAPKEQPKQGTEIRLPGC